jgi:CNT family concentrative nucleoside transporter
VGAMLLAFIGLISLINGVLGGLGTWLNIPDLSLEGILGWLFAPLAFVIGVPWSESTVAGSFIGQKLVVNEFVAYLNFAPYLKDEVLIGQAAMSQQTKAIVSFALCGFANLSSIAILLGGLGAMAPSRRQEIARFGLRAVLAGTLSNLMSATIAGFFLAISA